jgi:hypothetical protein
MSFSAHTVESAKQFLLSKLEEQAMRDGVSLSDIEKRMFLFSEVGTPVTDWEASERFDAEYDTHSYEKKIAQLLRRCYAREKKSLDGATSWKDALDSLGDQDFYGLVMVDEAGIPRASESLSSESFWEFILGGVPVAVAELAIAILGFVVVFRPELAHLVLPDWLRLLLLPVFFYLMWLTGEIFKRRSMK